MNGGFMTNYFEISRGVRQGCPLSPSLFILAVELLALKIRQNPNCGGIQLPNDQEVKISQFADDTTIITSNVDSLKSHLQVIDWFGTVSGLKLNKKKPKAIAVLRYWNSKVRKIQLKYWVPFCPITKVRMLKKISWTGLEKRKLSWIYGSLEILRYMVNLY